MKIAFINIFQDEAERGLETYVKNLASGLSGNHQVQILAGKSKPIPRWPVAWRAYLDPHGIKIALFTLKLIPKIFKEKYDIILPLNGGWQPALVRLVTWFYGGKTVIPGQSGRGWDDRNNLWCFPDAFVALTGSGEKWAKTTNPFVKTKKIPNGVDLDKFKKEGTVYKSKLKKPVVVCQGALEPSKRLDLAIKAVAQLERVSLLLVGKGSLRKELESLGRSLLGSRFEMVSVPHEAMPAVYRAGKLFTLPSEGTEAFGIAYVEAMASNLPVVATDDDTRREIVGKAGLFVNPEDLKAYSDSVRLALSKIWGDTPRLQAEKFGWKKITSDYENLFAELIKKN